MDCITVDVARKEGEPWGVQISGESPCYFENIMKGSPADEAGLVKGDYLISVNGVSVYDASHEHVVKLVGQCGRIARFRILPNPSESFAKPAALSKQALVKEEENRISQSSASKISNSESEDSESDDSEYIWKFSERNKKTPTTAKYKSYDIQVHYEKAMENEKPSKKGEIHCEQSSFIVTKEDQKEFDEHYQHEGNFAGKRATVAGAFTGDFNVIRSPKEDGDVIGVKSRVLAGIQHFSLSDDKEKKFEDDRGRILIYTTSLGINRSVAYNCQEARKILQGFRIRFEDRDVFQEPQFKDELFQRLGLSEDKTMPDLPILFIDGIYSGGFNEIVEMSDCGDLRIRLQDFPKYNIRQHCSTCKSKGIITCKSCNGKGSRKSNRFKVLKCGSCSQKGTVACPDCL